MSGGSAHPRLLSHHGVVAQHFASHRNLRQQDQLLGHPCLELAAVPEDGRILLLLVREALPRQWWGRIIALGTLNSGLFFGLLFIAAIRLPGGVAATFQALGPLFMVLLAWPMLGAIPSSTKVFAVALGAAGVALIVLKGNAAVDMIGVAAALGSALSVAIGGILVHKRGRPKSLLAFTGWQMVIAGVELSIVTALLGDVPAKLTAPVSLAWRSWHC